jgi:hypothetical protein
MFRATLPSNVGFLRPRGAERMARVTFSIKDVSRYDAEKFRRDFRLRQKSLEQYFTATRVTTLFAGNINVHVYDYSPPTAESLLPAWEGHRGQMKFAASRAKDGTANFVHELCHVHAPNEVRFLTEGYSTYLEEMLGNIEAFPTFGDSIENAIKKFGNSPLAVVELDRFDGIATQRHHEIGDNVGLETVIPDRRDRVNYTYLISGSFVKYLINAYGLYKFKKLYELSPLTPGVATVADPARYQAIFGKSLTELQADWLNWLAKQ